MHILFVTGEYPPQRGGVGAYTAELTKTLVAQGFQVSVLTSRSMGPASDAIKSVEKSNVVEDSVPTVYREIIRWGPQIWAIIRRKAIELQVDWIHVQYQTAAYAMNPAINFAPSFWRRMLRARAHPDGKKVRIAWTYHDLLVPYLFPKAGKRLRRWVTERPAHTTDLVIVTNEGDRKTLATRITAAAKTIVKIPIGSNIASVCLSTNERQTLRARWSYSQDDLVLAYFGFLNRSKGGTTLIQTLHQLAQRMECPDRVHLLMIGERVGASDPTNFAYLQEVEALITELGLSDRVQWTGHLPDTEVAAALNACDALVMLYEDGASLRRGTLMAGLANGCAIVTTWPTAPLPELVDGEHLLYVAAGDAAAAAFALERLLSDAELANRLRRNARKQSALFTWESIAKRHVDLYNTSPLDV